MQLRNFVFTKNNYSELDLDKLKKLEYVYILFGKEIAPTTGTPHLQGYVELEKRLSFPIVLERLPGFHIEPRKGSQKQAIEYCKKGNDFQEFGFPRSQGKRTDIYSAIEQIRTGSNIREVLENEDSLISSQVIKSFNLLFNYYEQRRDFKPIVHWYYGDTGTGKTRGAVRAATKFLRDNNMQTTDILLHDGIQSSEAIYFKSAISGKWWDGYDGHTITILDDLRPDSFKFVQLLNLLDRYPAQVEYKGGIRQFRSRFIIITAPKKPESFVVSAKELSYYEKDENVGQLTRRIDLVKEFTYNMDEEEDDDNLIPA